MSRKYKLSLTEGRGIALIKDGVLDGQILLIDEVNKKKDDKEDEEDQEDQKDEQKDKKHKKNKASIKKQRKEKINKIKDKSKDAIIKGLGHDFLNKLLVGGKNRKLTSEQIDEFIDLIKNRGKKTNTKQNKINLSNLDKNIDETLYDSDSSKSSSDSEEESSSSSSSDESSSSSSSDSEDNKKSRRKGRGKEDNKSLNKKLNISKAKLKKAYHIAINKLEEEDGKLFTLDDLNSRMVPIPHQTIRESLYIAGPSGAGKSTYTSNYVIQYKKLFKNPVFLFSRKQEDPALDKLGITRIQVNEELLKDPIQLEDLKNSLVIFDDVDVLDGKFKKYIFELRDTILEAGRSQNTYIICTAHQLLNYKQSRTMLSEAHAITVFPHTGSDFHIRRWLKIYVGLDKYQIEKIMKIPSRWITLYTHHPRYILWEHGAELL